MGQCASRDVVITRFGHYVKFASKPGALPVSSSLYTSMLHHRSGRLLTSGFPAQRHLYASRRARSYLRLCLLPPCLICLVFFVFSLIPMSAGCTIDPRTYIPSSFPLPFLQLQLPLRFRLHLLQQLLLFLPSATSGPAITTATVTAYSL